MMNLKRKLTNDHRKIKAKLLNYHIWSELKICILGCKFTAAENHDKLWMPNFTTDIFKKFLLISNFEDFR